MLQKIGRYEIRRELGRGGMAIVYLAFDPRFRRQVAIKVLPRQFTYDPRYLARFEQEAQVIATLEHPAIVPVYDFGERDDAPYLVMRYMPGGSLRDRLSGIPLSMAEIAPALQRLAPALDKAHELGIIHRDLKPSNILFDDDGRPYLGDFGIARLAEASHTMTVIGTPAYMSPEQVEGDLEPDGRADIYALGVMLFELLTGRQPYEAETPTKQMMAHVLKPVPNILKANPDVPPKAQDVINKAMAKDREHRYATAVELATAVSELDAFAAAPGLVTVAIPESEDAPQEEIEFIPPAEPSDEAVTDLAEVAHDDLPAPVAEVIAEPLLDEPCDVYVELPESAESVAGLPMQDDSGGTVPPLLPPADAPAEEGGLSRWIWWAGALALALIVIYVIRNVVWPIIADLQVDETAPAKVADKVEVVGPGYLDRAYNGEFSGSDVTILGLMGQEPLFNESVADFEEATGIDITYIGSEDLLTALYEGIEADKTHDIVDFPLPKIMAQYASDGKITDVTTFLPQDLLDRRYNKSWLDMATVPGPSGEPIVGGVWHRFNGKSYVWYPREEFEARGYAIPNNWDELTDLKHSIAHDGDIAWCVGIGAGEHTGWPTSDWTEDILLRIAPLEIYDAWVAGRLPFDSPEVRAAIGIWSDIWFDSAYTYGGRDFIVGADWTHVPELMLEDPPKCWLHRQADFIVGFFPDDAEYGRDYGVFYLPPVDQDLGKPLLVTGNIMSMFNDREEVRAVMELFTTPESTLDWRQAGVAVSPMQEAAPDRYGTELARELAVIVEQATSFRFDGSDQMPVEVGAGSFFTMMTEFVAGAIDLDTALRGIDASWPR